MYNLEFNNKANMMLMRSRPRCVNLSSFWRSSAIVKLYFVWNPKRSLLYGRPITDRLKPRIGHLISYLCIVYEFFQSSFQPFIVCIYIIPLLSVRLNFSFFVFVFVFSSPTRNGLVPLSSTSSHPFLLFLYIDLGGNIVLLFILHFFTIRPTN